MKPKKCALNDIYLGEAAFWPFWGLPQVRTQLYLISVFLRKNYMQSWSNSWKCINRFNIAWISFIFNIFIFKQKTSLKRLKYKIQNWNKLIHANPGFSIICFTEQLGIFVIFSETCWRVRLLSTLLYACLKTHIFGAFSPAIKRYSTCELFSLRVPPWSRAPFHLGPCCYAGGGRYQSSDKVLISWKNAQSAEMLQSVQFKPKRNGANDERTAITLLRSVKFTEKIGKRIISNLKGKWGINRPFSSVL